MKTFYLLLMAMLTAVMAVLPAAAQKRLIIIDQDGSGPADSNQRSMLLLLQSPDVQVLGITIVTGDAWRDEEVAHTLRMLELTGHANVPVVPGAEFPLVRSEQETRIGAQLFGNVTWLGAWGGRQDVTQSAAVQEHDPATIPPLPEGAPHTKPLEEDAAHFLIRQVRAHPGQVTILAFGPLTDVALAVAIDPKLPEMTKGIAIMGSSLNPHSDELEFLTDPRSEFNFWFDPEAAHMVLRAHWPRIDVTTIDASIKTMYTQQLSDAIAQHASAAAAYVVKYETDRYYMYDELAACTWLDPSLVTKSQDVFMDVDLSHGPSYGRTLAWSEKMKPRIELPLVHAQLDVDVPRFTKMVVQLLSAK